MAPPRPPPVVHRLVQGAVGLVSLLALVACSGQDGPGTDSGGGFISHVPGSASGDRSSGDGDVSVDGAAEDPSAGDGDDGGAERAISEADILQVDGDRLYALSRYSGLSVINIADPGNLRLLGSYRTSATPFEMYLEGSVVYVMFNGWYTYAYDEGADSYTWETTSRMQALDVSDPGDIRLLGDREVPGEIADSRKVGTVIYLATHQTNWCWGCDDVASSRVTSFDVSSPEDFTPVDSVAFQTEEGWQRSISATQDRIYVSGWVWNEDQRGTIDVVDISDPSGDMKKGASVKIAGQVQSRWQMEEHEGVLRVISQPGGWGTTNPPVVETFQVASANDITALASLEMILPRPESLRSVRYDGDRAYAITFEQTDPLFTFDLSDPMNPRQIGELEIPGWVYHMEPRGDRIYALGFDDASEEGALHVSLFDVSDLANPTMLDRVNFGGSWGGFAEEQDRIHKAFNILPDQGLITVPFYGESASKDSCGWTYGSGIQLIDMTTEDLTLRGVAPQVGQARRALYYNETLFGISDNAVQTFDISDRDAPKSVDQLATARNVQNIRVMGSTMLRFGSDWWTGQAMLDFAALSNVESAESLGELDLAALIEDDAESCDGYSWSQWGGQVFVHGSYAYVPRFEERESESGGDYSWSTQLTLFIIDISERTAPKLAGKFELDPANGDTDEYYAGIIQTDSALLVGRQKSTYTSGGLFGGKWENSFSYDVVDLSDPEAPAVVERYAVPEQIGAYGWGYGFEGCSIDMGWGWWGYYGGPNALTSGDLVASQHSEPLKDGSGRVRYYLDRLDVSDPAHPKLLKSVNIPGKVVDFDHGSGRIVTVDYVMDAIAATSWEACYSQGFYAEFDEGSRVCQIYRRNLNVLVLSGDEAILKDSHLIDDETMAGSIAISGNKVFYNPVSYADSGAPTLSVVVLDIDTNGEVSQQGAVEISDAPYWWGQLLARDGRAFLIMNNQLTVVDATSSDVTLQRHEMGGWGCNELEVHESTAYCAMGQFGVKSFPLD